MAQLDYSSPGPSKKIKTTRKRGAKEEKVTSVIPHTTNWDVEKGNEQEGVKKYKKWVAAYVAPDLGLDGYPVRTYNLHILPCVHTYILPNLGTCLHA